MKDNFGENIIGMYHLFKNIYVNYPILNKRLVVNLIFKWSTTELNLCVQLIDGFIKELFAYKYELKINLIDRLLIYPAYILV